MSREIVSTGGQGRVSSDAMKFGVVALVVAVIVIAGFWVARSNYHPAMASLSSPAAVVRTI